MQRGHGLWRSHRHILRNAWIFGSRRFVQDIQWILFTTSIKNIIHWTMNYFVLITCSSYWDSLHTCSWLVGTWSTYLRNVGWRGTTCAHSLIHIPEKCWNIYSYQILVAIPRRWWRRSLRLNCQWRSSLSKILITRSYCNYASSK